MYEVNQINKKFFHNKRKGKYIEIGAGSRGATDFFEKELGWSGILVEPNPISFDKLCKYRPNNVIYNKIISTEPKVEFHYYHDESADMSSIISTVPDDISIIYYNDEIILNEKKTTVILESKSLKHIIDGHYDFMIIDTNGHEVEVLKSWNFSQTIEYIIFSSNILSEKRAKECDDFLNKNNYILIDSVLINYCTFDVYKKEYIINDTCQIS